MTEPAVDETIAHHTATAPNETFTAAMTRVARFFDDLPEDATEEQVAIAAALRPEAAAAALGGLTRLFTPVGGDGDAWQEENIRAWVNLAVYLLAFGTEVRGGFVKQLVFNVRDPAFFDDLLEPISSLVDHAELVRELLANLQGGNPLHTANAVTLLARLATRRDLAAFSEEECKALQAAIEPLRVAPSSQRLAQAFAQMPEGWPAPTEPTGSAEPTASTEPTVATSIEGAEKGVP